MPKSIKQRLLLACAPAPSALLLRGLARSWRNQVLKSAPVVPGDCGQERFIYAFWHEYIIPTVGQFRDLPIHGLASLSFDGDLISALLGKLGFPPPARGSSSRGGAEALMELRSFLKAGDHVVITVDGPRGPRRKVRDGALKLSQLSGQAVVPVGFASRSQLRLRSWDKTLIPAPFSQGAFSFGKPFHVPPDAPSLVRYRHRLERDLEKVCSEAEQALKV